jgi:hypothetical protein
MQKVEGSNPFSRFFVIPLHMGGSDPAQEPLPNGTVPAYRRYFGQLVPKNDADVRRLAAISLDSPSPCTSGGTTVATLR